MLSVIMLSVIMLNVVMLSVVAPMEQLIFDQSVSEGREIVTLTQKTVINLNSNGPSFNTGPVL
jgi:hypothetical protein